jgi:hypothetical protein
MRRPHLIAPHWAVQSGFDYWLRSDNEVLVFSTNTRGCRNKGIAKIAIDHYGAETGEWWGPTGRCYAIPLYDDKGHIVEDKIVQLIEVFKLHAYQNKSKKFRVARLTPKMFDDQVRSAFESSPSNLILPKIYLV